MSFRTCTVSCTDLVVIQHSVEVTAASVYEAVGKPLRIFREHGWVPKMERAQTVLTVSSKQPEVKHHMRMADFNRWIESQGRTPAEMSLKTRTRELLRD
jgi:hypothetical protein